MSEYIVDIPTANFFMSGVYYPDERHEPIAVLEEIVRCRDCKHYYEAEEYHPNGNYDRRCCKYFDTYDDEVSPSGFCAGGERRES